MRNSLLPNNFYPMIWVQEEGDELSCDGSVTRYGPQSAASASGQFYRRRDARTKWKIPDFNNAAWIAKIVVCYLKVKIESENISEIQVKYFE